jgi:exodeoxyribonuclease V alpha subunit
MEQPLKTDTRSEVLAGLVERVTFHNDETGFCVLRVKARGQRDLITILGHAAMISAGEFVQASGSWVNDRTHGVQFRASFLKATAPTTIEGIEKYLGSGMIRGIGPIYAKKLVRAFGEAVFEIIEQEPGRLREVTGIGPKRAERVVAGWAEQKVIREIMLFLHSDGVGTSRAVRIYKTYGADAVQLISENPYRLARDIRGIGFRTADQIAAKLGIEKTALIRVRAGISYALAEAMDDGHCGLPVEELFPLTEMLLEVPVGLVETALSLELNDGAVVADDLEGRRCVFLAALYRAEREIAAKLTTLAVGKPPWPSIDIDKATPWVEQRTKLALADSQNAALRAALVSKVMVITGGPGVGKTTLVNSLLKILAAKAVTIALCAPTGRAAKRLLDSTGIEAKTIHRLLETDPKTGRFRHGRRRDFDGRRAADAGGASGSAGRSGTAAGWGCRSTALGWAGAGSGRHHRVGCRAGRAFDRDLPPGGREPDHHQRASNQPGTDARSRLSREWRFLLRRCGRG